MSLSLVDNTKSFISNWRDCNDSNTFRCKAFLANTKWHVEIEGNYLKFNVFIVDGNGVYWKSRYNIDSLEDAKELGVRLLFETYIEKRK